MSAPPSTYKQFPRKKYNDIEGSAVSITAYAGGGQANATQLTKKFNGIATVTSANDSVKLPAAYSGRQLYIKNNGANDLDVFPASGEQISTFGVDTAQTLASGQYQSFTCIVAGTWEIL